jgi:hypothetical protein
LDAVKIAVSRRREFALPRRAGPKAIARNHERWRCTGSSHAGEQSGILTIGEQVWQGSAADVLRRSIFKVLGDILDLLIHLVETRLIGAVKGDQGNVGSAPAGVRPDRGGIIPSADVVVLSATGDDAAGPARRI